MNKSFILAVIYYFCGRENKNLNHWLDRSSTKTKKIPDPCYYRLDV